ncbi:MAG: hypothetical protein ACRDZ0_12050 [Acidimicrobiales bacterium]
MTRVAAVADIHVGVDSVGRVAAGMQHVNERADLLLRGVTPGVRVRNVAQPVIGRAYRIYDRGEPAVREAPVAASA